jgi:RNA polymerase sigma-70 factor, ECF subfamily
MRLGVSPCRRSPGPNFAGAIVATVVQREAPDKELITRAEEGDRDAFAALYERHFQGLYDFALRIVRDADLAADVVQSTFVKAWDAARNHKDVANVKAWLYTVAHNLAIDELRLRKRIAEPSADGGREEDSFPFAIVDPSKLSDPEAVVQDRELVALVWDSAAALNPQEYALLDLHLRRGLDAEELGRHLCLAKSAVYTRLSRLRDSLEEAVTSTLLMRRGRHECLELDWLLEELRATEVTQPVRRAIKEHLETCERCQESKRRFVSPAEIFAGISLVPVALDLQSEVWGGVAAQLGVGGAVAASAAVAANGAGGGAANGAAATANGASGAAANGAGAGAVNGGGPGTQAGADTAAQVATPIWGPLDPVLSLPAAAKGFAVLALATGAAVVIATLAPNNGGLKVVDPGDVRSTTHAVGRPSTNNVVRMAWSRHDADAYSVSWTRGRRALPDQRADLSGTTTSATSKPLRPGRWYFNLRTRGDGEWTSTVHVGPFVIQAELTEEVRKRIRYEPSSKPQEKRSVAVADTDTDTGSTATASSDSPRVVAVASAVATKQTAQEPVDEPKEKPAPRRPPTGNQVSTPAPAVTTTSPPPPPPPAIVANTPTAQSQASGDEEDSDEEEEEKKPQTTQTQPVEPPPDEGDEDDDDEDEDDDKGQRSGQSGQGGGKGKGDGKKDDD